MMTKQQRVFRIPKYDVGDFRTDEEALESAAGAASSRERINWGQRLLEIPSAWTASRGKGIRVAILDTGADLDHPDLKVAIVAERDFSGSGSAEDGDGHGTHCAGIIGARRNGVGLVGVAPECELLIGKVLADDGRGSYDWIANGIDWAVSAKADIISMSLGGSATTPELHRAIHDALAAGATVICAAGNDGSFGVNTIGYPGRYGSVLTVAAHDPNGNRAGFSSRGGEVDFMAPGTDIWSTYRNGGYATLSGTSMATPFVAGLAALILSKHRTDPGATPIETNEDVRDHLMFMATHPGHHDNTEGYGPLLPFRYFGALGM